MKPSLNETAVRRIWKHSVLSYIGERLIGEDDDRIGQFDLDRLRRETGHGKVPNQGEEQQGAGASEEDGTQ